MLNSCCGAGTAPDGSAIPAAGLMLFVTAFPVLRTVSRFITERLEALASE